MKVEEAIPKVLNVLQVYEGGGATWDFDGVGFSLGALQWNIGSDTLQPMLRRMFDSHDVLMRRIFGAHFNELKTAMRRQPTSIQMQFAKHINDYPNRCLKAPWDKMLKELVTSSEWKAIEPEFASKYVRIARKDCKWSGVHTLRSFTAFFDMAVQSGGMGWHLKLAMSAAKPFLSKMVKEDQKIRRTERNKAWLIGCSAARSTMSYLSNPKYAMNTFKRRLGIIEGGYNWRKGELPQVNEQVDFDAAKYGITDEPIEDL